MDINEQEQIFMEHWIDGWAHAVNRLQEGRQRLAQLALARFRQGYQQFGESIFLDENSDTLLEEIDEELADAIVYGAVMTWHARQESVASAERS